MALILRQTKGSKLTINEMDNNLIYLESLSGATSGTSGTSGSSGVNGTSGTSGVDGTSGSSGVNGANGTNGTSGVDGANGTNGTSGVDGANGTSGVNGTNGTSGVDGTSGTNGTSGTSGINGTNITTITYTGKTIAYFDSETGLTSTRFVYNPNTGGMSSTSPSQPTSVSITPNTLSQSYVNNITQLSAQSNLAFLQVNSYTGYSYTRILEQPNNNSIGFITRNIAGVLYQDNGGPIMYSRSGATGSTQYAIFGLEPASGFTDGRITFYTPIVSKAKIYANSGITTDELTLNGTTYTTILNGTDGTSGTSGINGINGADGTSGTSGTSGAGLDATIADKAIAYNEGGTLSGSSLLYFNPATLVFNWASGITSTNNKATTGFRLEKGDNPPFSSTYGFGITFGNRTGNIGANSLCISTENEEGATTWNGIASGEASVSIGRANQALGRFSAAFGDRNVSSGEGSITAGQNCITGSRSIAVGVSTQATGENSAAFNTSTASGQYSASFNRTSAATGYASTATGGFTAAQGIFQTVVGYRNIATGTTTATDSPTDGNSPTFIVGAGLESTAFNAMEVAHDYTKIYNTLIMKDVVNGNMYACVMSGGTFTTYQV